ncbi:DNA-binding response regulator [Stenotrophobium rhamnosiphilum]|uniref:DNA-binding response regulator n=2 Tax=Stenotrophobium rhamnosiphilum TaxID=2029166 RepID=A0A2T5MDW6_9GAMM|nr:DNA-binding response regulator [Stenotrophobium rhamnosiphilum]
MSTAKIDITRSIGARGATSSADGILVVDDHELVRLGFRALVQSQASVAEQSSIALFEANTLAQALSLYREHREEIAVIVLDLNLPDSNGLDGLMAFRQHFPAATVVVLSGSDHPATVQNALALGAVSFFSKAGDLGDMVGFVHTCLLHGPEVASQRRSRPTATFPGFSSASDPGEFAASAGQALSTRQLQILQWLLQGKSNREISQLAFLSEGTVKNHVSTLLLSFGVRSRAQLISKLRT